MTRSSLPSPSRSMKADFGPEESVLKPDTGGVGGNEETEGVVSAVTSSHWWLAPWHELSWRRQYSEEVTDRERKSKMFATVCIGPVCLFFMSYNVLLF